METYIDRLRVEIEDLHGRLTKLSSFIDGETFKGLPDRKRNLLIDQRNVMTELEKILLERLGLEER